MPYSFDEDKYKSIFDNMYGKGAYQKGISYAGQVGNELGRLDLLKKQREQEATMLEAARKDAAKKERERQKQKEKEKKTGRKETELSKQIDDKKKRAKAENLDISKPQSAIGKFLHLNPDNNAFFDTLDLMSRPLNAYQNMATNEAKFASELKKRVAAGEITEKQYYDELNSYSNKKRLQDLKDGFAGKEKKFGSDFLEAAGVKNKVAQFGGGLALDIMADPMNLLGAPIGKAITGGAKLVGKGVSKLPGAEKATNALDNLFVGRKLRQQTLNGGTSNDLVDLERNMENSRLYMHDKSKTDVAKAILKGGEDNGTRVGKVMEEPLIAPKPLDIQTAPNVLNPQAALDLMNPALKQSLDPMKPLARITGTTFNALDQPLENGFLPNMQQKLGWGRKGLLNDTVDLGVAGKYSTKGNRTDLGVYGTWGGQQIETQVEKILTSGGNIEQAAEVMRYHPKIRETAQVLMDSNEELRAFASQNGIDIKDLEGYMAHFATKEARKYLDDAGETISEGTGAIGGNKAVTKREIHDSVRNANEKMKTKTGVNQFFNPDAYVSTAGGQQRMINYVVHEATKKQILDNADFSRALNSGQKARKGMIERTIDGKRYELTKGANVVLTNFERHTTDESVNTFLKGFDTLQNMWKKTALFSGGFHIRNAFGNSWNMYLSGMRADEVVKYQTEAMAHLEGIQARMVGRATENVTTKASDVLSSTQKARLKELNKNWKNGLTRREWKGSSDDFDEYMLLKDMIRGAEGTAGTTKVAQKAKAIDKTYEEFLQQGLKQTGSTADFAKDAEAHLMSDVRFKTKGTGAKILHPFAEVGQKEGAWDKTKQLLDAPFQASRQLGDAADEVSRFALFKWARDSGMSAKEAGEKVREVLFDYTQLTDAERKVFKRMAPFYTWTRKNAEFQVKAFAKNPEKFNKLNLAIQNGYSASDQNQEITPDYMKNSLAMPIPGTDRMLSVNLPASDLSNLLNPGKLMLDSMTPLAKVPIELAMNQKTLNGAPIQEFAGQTKNVPVLGDIGVKKAYAMENLLTPVRNMSGAKEKQEAGASPLDTLLKLTGSEVVKKRDEESFQRQADYKENQRLGDIIKKSEKQDGKDIRSIDELNKSGIYTDEEEAKIANTLTEAGYKPQQIDMLMSLRKKVYNGNKETAAKTARVLLQMGVPSDVVQMLTKDYLDY